MKFSHSFILLGTNRRFKCLVHFNGTICDVSCGLILPVKHSCVPNSINLLGTKLIIWKPNSLVRSHRQTSSTDEKVSLLIEAG